MRVEPVRLASDQYLVCGACWGCVSSVDVVMLASGKACCPLKLCFCLKWVPWTQLCVFVACVHACVSELCLTPPRTRRAAPITTPQPGPSSGCAVSVAVPVFLALLLTAWLGTDLLLTS